jgi:hypothetical protein
MRDETRSAADENFAIGPLDAAPIGPIDTDPAPADAVPGKKKLALLEFARPKKALLESGDYLGVIQALDQERPPPDDANNLGCAWAWLAYTEDDYALWDKAIAALRRAQEGATTDKQRARAKKNLELVQEALEAGACV